jgi:deoxyuridine 5'-triphosphate nucleotidohydrolase
MSATSTQASPNTQVLNFKRLDPRATLPTRGSSASAGLDLYSIEEIIIEPRQRVLARTGLAVAVPPGFYGRVAPRSGLAVKNGLDVLAGVIDSDYRGEVCCALLNTGDETLTLPQGSRLCQLIIEQIITPSPAWADNLDETTRGGGGFGSTG